MKEVYIETFNGNENRWKAYLELKAQEKSIKKFWLENLKSWFEDNIPEGLNFTHNTPNKYEYNFIWTRNINDNPDKVIGIWFEPEKVQLGVWIPSEKRGNLYPGISEDGYLFEEIKKVSNKSPEEFYWDMGNETEAVGNLIIEKVKELRQHIST